MRSARHNHRRYVAGCPHCKAAARAWYAARARRAVDGQWELRLTGEFCGRFSTHVLPVPDEAVGRRRAAWWSAYRRDVVVVLRQRTEAAA